MMAAFFTFTVISDLQNRPRGGVGIAGRLAASPLLSLIHIWDLAQP